MIVVLDHCAVEGISGVAKYRPEFLIGQAHLLRIKFATGRTSYYLDF